MERQVKIKDVFKPVSVHKEFYTGGSIALTNDGKNLLCQCRNHVTVVDIDQVSISRTIPDGLTTYNSFEESDYTDDYILTFALSEDNTLLATGHKSGIISIWNWKESQMITCWKSGHKGVLAQLCFNKDNTLIASGGTDSCVKVWNIEGHSCSYRLAGSLRGVISVIVFRQIKDKQYIFVSSDESSIRGWLLQSNSKQTQKYHLKGHFSPVTSILFDDDNSHLISCGRDKAVIYWDLKEEKKIRTIPVYESIEAAVLLPNCIELPGYEKPIIGTFLAVGGDTGKLRIFDVEKGTELYSSFEGDSEKNNPSIDHLLYDSELRCLYKVNSNHNITSYIISEKFPQCKQMTGYLDEILDIAFFGDHDNYFAVAANSCDIHVYNQNMNCSLLKGHTDLVVSLATSRGFPNLLVSGSKDNAIRVWMMKDDILNCVAVGSRHTASVGAVAISFNSSLSPFVVSGSEDNTLKLWKLPNLKYKTCLTLNVSKTEIAHEKAINSVCISPNDALIATASQDKTAKIWSAKDLSIVGILRGHRRGVWCAKFSPVDQVLLTSSADATLRLWAISDFSCLKTLEGQDCAILNCDFLNNGIQIISSGSDGLLKVWLIKSGECLTTLDHHAARVWAIAISKDESKILTGGADSRIVFWHDQTEESRLENLQQSQEKLEQEQQLANLIKANELLPALQLAIKLDRPKQAFKILDSLSSGKTDALKNLIDQLRDDHKETLLNYAVTWNTNSKHCFIAQLVISLMLEDIAEKKLKIPDKNLDGLIAYTIRHNQRLNTLMEDLHLVNYTLKMMQPAASQ
ncbi:transducin beta-like protein 3 [Planococcus citri]|uniref:transducin beta-like protein 3 n=1 Tax=Planococcus citri TaxID=170843 RepID=UPI0031F8A6C9